MKRKDGEIKLAVFDLDGTLLNSGDLLLDNTAEALRALYHAGVKIMINSGRVPSMVEAYFYEAKIRGIRSGADGACIVDDRGVTLYRKAVPPDVLARLVAFFREKGVSFLLMTEQDIYACEGKIKLRNRFRRYEELAERYGLPFPEIRNIAEYTDFTQMPVYKIPVMESREGRPEEVLGFPEELLEHIEVTRSGPGIIDITAAGVSKGAAVRTVAGYYGIRREEICCVGDYDNDVQMFREASISVAMGNAPERVKNAADYVTEDHDNGGAAGAVMRYMLRREERDKCEK